MSVRDCVSVGAGCGSARVEGFAGDLFSALGLDISQLRASGMDQQLVEWAAIESHMESFLDNDNDEYEEDTAFADESMDALVTAATAAAAAPSGTGAVGTAGSTYSVPVDDDEDGPDDITAAIDSAAAAERKLSASAKLRPQSASRLRPSVHWSTRS